jgi:uncharacterized membrane protein
MTKNRLEAFSDGVIAIIITIMVLELHRPEGTDWLAIKRLLPELVAYALSFTLVAIYWGNHHHLLHTVPHVNSKIIWANTHLLFWLSLVPFATGWASTSDFSTIPVAIYAALQAMCGIAYYILLRQIAGSHPHQGPLRESLEKQTRKGTISLLIYIVAMPAAFLHPAISAGLFFIVAIIWLIPDRNIENALKD